MVNLDVGEVFGCRPAHVIVVAVYGSGPRGSVEPDDLWQLVVPRYGPQKYRSSGDMPYDRSIWACKGPRNDISTRPPAIAGSVSMDDGTTDQGEKHGDTDAHAERALQGASRRQSASAMVDGHSL